jgi:hypothetical protein
VQGPAAWSGRPDTGDGPARRAAAAERVAPPAELAPGVGETAQLLAVYENTPNRTGSPAQIGCCRLSRPPAAASPAPEPAALWIRAPSRQDGVPAARLGEPALQGGDAGGALGGRRRRPRPHRRRAVLHGWAVRPRRRRAGSAVRAQSCAGRPRAAGAPGVGEEQRAARAGARAPSPAPPATPLPLAARPPPAARQGRVGVRHRAGGIPRVAAACGAGAPPGRPPLPHRPAVGGWAARAAPGGPRSGGARHHPKHCTGARRVAARARAPPAHHTPHPAPPPTRPRIPPPAAPRRTARPSTARASRQTSPPS